MSEGTIIEGGSRRAARRERELRDRRRDLVAAATLVFADKGFHEAQMAEIATAAELSLASLYALFEGKEALFEDVLQAAVRKMDEEVRPRVEGVADPGQRILTLIDAMFDCFEANRALLRLLLVGTHGLPWRIRERMGNAADALLEGFHDWVRSLCAELTERENLAGLDPDALAAALLGGTTHLAATTLSRHPEAELGSSAAAIRRLFESLVGGGVS